MTASAGSAYLSVIPSFDGLQGNLEKGLGGPMGLAGVSGGRKYGDSAGRSMATAFTGHAKKAALLAGAGLAVAGAVAFKIGKDSIASASDLNESLNAVNVTYGKQAAAVKKLGRDAAESLGLSNVEFNALGVRFSSFATTIAGGPGPKVVGVLDDLTTRAGDFASVMNLDVSTAAELFQSGLAGQSEPLRAYGIDLSAATVASYAYSKGIAESGTQLTQTQKVQATYGLLMKDTKKNAGDFANTSDDLANSQRILSAEWENGKAKLGKGLLPIVTDITGYLVKKGIPAFNDFSDWFTKTGIPAIGDFADGVKPLANELIPALGSTLGTVRDVLADAAPYAKDLIGAFNDMPDWAKKGVALGGIAGFAASKTGVLGLAKGGKGGVVSGILGGGVQKVFVTNPGFGGTGGGGGVGAGVGAAAGSLWRGMGGVKGVAGKAGMAASAFWAGNKIENALPAWATWYGKGDKGGLMPGAGDKGWLSWFQSTEQGVGRVVQALDPLVSKMGVFGDSLDLVGGKKVDPSLTVPGMDVAQRDLQKFLRLEIEAGHPITPYVTLSGVQAAQQQIATLISSIHALNSAGDHALPYVSGGGSSSAPPASSAPPSKGGKQPAPTGRGKVILSVGGREFDAYVDERATGTAQREIDADRRFQRVKGGR